MQHHRHRRCFGFQGVLVIQCIVLAAFTASCRNDFEPLHEYNEIYEGIIQLENRQVSMKLSLVVNEFEHTAGYNLEEFVTGTLETESESMPLIVMGNASHYDVIHIDELWDPLEGREFIELRIMPDVRNENNIESEDYEQSYRSFKHLVGAMDSPLNEFQEVNWFEYRLVAELRDGRLEGFFEQHDEFFGDDEWTLGTFSLIKTETLSPEVHIDETTTTLDPFIFQTTQYSDISWSHDVRLDSQ